MYRLEITRKAQQQLNRLPAPMQKRIQSAVRQLPSNPRPPGCRKMKDMVNGWRLRVGVYRIIYEIRDDVLLIVIIRIGHRRDVYR